MSAPPPPPSLPASDARAVGGGRTLTGTPAVPGVAYGPVARFRREPPAAALTAFETPGGADADAALAAFDLQGEAVAAGFIERAERTTGASRDILMASAGLARDPGLRQRVAARLADGDALASAVHEAVASFVDSFTALGGRMAERATDLLDIERRIIARLVGEHEPSGFRPDIPSVVVADDLAPADTAELDASVVLALVTERGGPTSHTAIIARQLAIPCVVGCREARSLPAGEPVLVDGHAGTVRSGMDPILAGELVRHDRDRHARGEAWSGPGSTSDEERISLLANVADPASSRAAAAAPVEGVGLFRTEFCFLDRSEEPSVAEQAAVYADVLAPFAESGRKVVVRTLDAGTDKPLRFATVTGETNPALGVRGLRSARAHSGLLDRQLDAIVEAARTTGAETWVMAPMVSTAAEAADFAGRARDRGLVAGIMIEVPSAALLADRVIAHVDFLSIGTNDLTQYVMAADRLAGDLTDLADPWQPAVLHLIAETASAGLRAGKPVGICGEAAADPLLAIAFAGMGITSLSMVPSAVRTVGARLGEVTMQTCRAAAAAALTAADPGSGREAVRRVLDGASHPAARSDAAD